VDKTVELAIAKYMNSNISGVTFDSIAWISQIIAPFEPEISVLA